MYAPDIANLRNARNSIDRDLVNLAKFTLKDADEKKIPHALSITLPDIAVFAANVESSLNNATESIAVESDDKNIDTAEVEDAIRAGLGSANERLTKAGRWLTFSRSRPRR